MSKITVTTIAGQTSGSDANKVKIESGDQLGIGTTPTHPLTVNGQIKSTGANGETVQLQTSSQYTGISFIGSDGTRDAIIDYDHTGGVMGIKAHTSAHKISMTTGGYTERLGIDASGRVTMPSQPVFFATAEANIPMSNSYSELTAFSNGQVNVGTHYNTSNGRFTAPVAGTYQFGVASIGNSNADVYRFRPYKNGSSLNNYELRIHTEGGAYGTNGEYCFIVTLAVNDYISIFGYSDSSNNAYGDSNYRYSYFRGHLMS